MRVLVTGASGFIGSAVVQRLLARGHSVWGLVRTPAGAAVLARRGAAPILGDMAAPDTYVPWVRQADVVIHAAQEPLRGRATAAKAHRMHASDRAMTRALAAACIDSQALLLYTSGALTYAKTTAKIITPETPLAPCLLAAGHAEMVAELGNLAARQPLRHAVIVPGMVYGPGGLLRQSAQMLARGQYRVIGPGTNLWSLVQVDDLAELYCLAAERGRAGASYLAGDQQPLALCDFVHAVCDELRIPRVGHVPAWFVGWWIGRPLVEAATASTPLDASATRAELGWHLAYPTLADGLPSSLQALRPSGAARAGAAQAGSLGLRAREVLQRLRRALAG